MPIYHTALIPWTAEFLGTGAWMEDDIEWVLRGVEGFQGPFCSLFCCYHLMVVTTADSICTASPILLISQPASLPTSQLYFGLQVWNPLLSPLLLSPRLSTTYSTGYLPTSNILYLPITSILERENAIEMPYGDDTLNSQVRDERGGL